MTRHVNHGTDEFGCLYPVNKSPTWRPSSNSYWLVYRFVEDAPAPTSRPPRDDCGGALKGVGGVLTSPGYPSHVPDAMDCIWVIRVESPKHIHVQVAELQFRGSTGEFTGQVSRPRIANVLIVKMLFVQPTAIA